MTRRPKTTLAFCTNPDCTWEGRRQIIYVGDAVKLLKCPRCAWDTLKRGKRDE